MYVLDADENMRCSHMRIYILGNSDFNAAIIKEIQNYPQWFIHHLGMYPRVLTNDQEYRNDIIPLESLCPDSLDRIKRDFEKGGFSELLERLICRQKLMECLENEKENLYVKLCLVDSQIKTEGKNAFVKKYFGWFWLISTILINLERLLKS